MALSRTYERPNETIIGGVRRAAGGGKEGIYRRIPPQDIPFDSGPLDDQETAHAADSLFAMLDA